MEPLNMTHIGTPKNPIVVKSHDPIRFVGCTGKVIEVFVQRKSIIKRKTNCQLH